MTQNQPPGLMSLQEATSRLLDRIAPCSDIETLALAQARDRILAEDIPAQHPVPGFDNSAMDGYAVSLHDFDPARAQPVQGKAMAGAPWEGTLTPGHCVRIMTGAPIPAGAHAVIIQENATPGDDGVRFQRTPGQGDNIRRAGEDLAAGACAVAAGQRLGPTDLALLSSTGNAWVPVYRKTRVALFSTGDELREPGQPLRQGDIYDSNRPLIRAVLEQLNVDILDLGTLPDRLDAIRDALLKADAQCDFVITTGGVSVGEADFVRDVLEQEGQVDFWKLAIKPGKPVAFGQLPNSWFLGLPGNPVSAMVTFQLLGWPAIRKFQGGTYQPMQKLRARMLSSLDRKPGRMEFLRGHYYLEDNTLWVERTRADQGSHILSSFSRANCYIVLDETTRALQKGEWVTLWLPH